MPQLGPLAASAPSLGSAPVPAIHYWRLDEGSGATANDGVGAVNGTIVNSPSWVTGKWGYVGDYGLNLNGSNQYIDMGMNIDLTGSYTLYCWFKTAFAPAATGNFISRNNDGIGAGFFLRMSNTGTIQCIHYPKPGLNSISSAGAYADSNWHMAACTFEVGVGSALYVDGVSQGTVASTTSGIGSFTQKFMVGRQDYTTGRYFGGVIDNPMVFDYAKTASEVLTDYNNSSPPV